MDEAWLCEQPPSHRAHNSTPSPITLTVTLTGTSQGPNFPHMTLMQPMTFKSHNRSANPHNRSTNHHAGDQAKLSTISCQCLTTASCSERPRALSTAFFRAARPLGGGDLCCPAFPTPRRRGRTAIVRSMMSLMFIHASGCADSCCGHHF